VQQRRGLGIGLGFEDGAQQARADIPRLQQAAAVGQRPLAEDLTVAGLVHDLGAEEHLGFEEVVVHPPHPLGRQVGGDHLDLGQRRAELADGVLDVVGQLLQIAPRDVTGGGPLPGDGLFVELADVVGPHVGLLVEDVAHVRRRVLDVGTARRHGAARGDVGHIAVAADGDVHHGEAARTRFRLHPPLAARPFEPGPVERSTHRRLGREIGVPGVFGHGGPLVVLLGLSDNDRYRLGGNYA
jgi:hypothetical protein